MDTDAAGIALAEQIATIDSQMVSYGWNPDSVVAPCVFPKEWSVDFTADRVTLGGDLEPTDFIVWILVSRSDDQTGQTLLKTYKSLARAAVYSDSSLGGTTSDCFVSGIRAPGFEEYAGTQYLLLELTVQAYG
jgi:hypothetical protein